MVMKKRFRKRGVTNKAPRKFNYTAKTSNALVIAKRALQLAKRTNQATTELKYRTLNIDSDVAGTASIFGSALAWNLTSPPAYDGSIFNTDSITGNRAFMRYASGYYEIHMDNLNNEEETVNFVVAIVQPKKDFDNLQSTSDVVYVRNGIPFFNPRLMKVHYYKHFTRTMGGTSPGTAGESIAKGKFFLRVNKSIRYDTQGGTGFQNGQASSYQDHFYLMVFTDNTSADTENPRMNGHVIGCWRDTDINHA